MRKRNKILTAAVATIIFYTANFAGVVETLGADADLCCFKIVGAAAILRESGKTNQDDPVLNNDPRIARKAVYRASEAKDIKALRLALGSRFLSIRKLAVDGIRKLDDKASILRLIDILKINRGIIGGGTETAYQQRELSISTMEALKYFTKLDFEILKPLEKYEQDDRNRKMIERVIRESLRWWEENSKN